MTPITLNELADRLGATLHGDGNVTVSAIASLENAKAGELTFLNKSSYRHYLETSEASAILLKQQDVELCKTNALVVKDPYLAYAKAAQLFDKTPACARGIAPTAYIAPSAKVGKNVAIGHHAVIEDGVELGDEVQIGAGCVIGANAKIGARTRLWANVTIYHGVTLGQDCLLQSGTVIGADGFGYAKDNSSGHWEKIPQVGSVIIGDRVEIGAGSAIDRGAISNTVIGNGVVIDNLCQIGHNVQLGDNCCICGGTVIGGSLKMGRNCLIAGACVLNGHIEITDNVVVTGMGMVMRSIEVAGIYSSGIPLQTNKEWRKSVPRLMRIGDMHERVRELEKLIKK
ncbi:MAG: UDP-3-O-(3-hydroxymyristoyl)glucosamine N-acyltransferase [Vibrionaceae bacterium]